MTQPVPPSGNYPTEKKVTTATAAALITAFVMGFLLRAVPALAALNDVFEAIILSVVTSVVTYVVAWWTKHSPRPE